MKYSILSIIAYTLFLLLVLGIYQSLTTQSPKYPAFRKAIIVQNTSISTLYDNEELKIYILKDIQSNKLFIHGILTSEQWDINDTIPYKSINNYTFTNNK